MNRQQLSQFSPSDASLPTTAHIPIVLVGHRCIGKTTLGPMIAQILKGTFVDLDECIESQYGQSCAQLVARNASAFRAAEEQCLRDTLSRAPFTSPTIIAAGAGCQYLPEGCFYIWLEREGWQECARIGRARLRPELSFEEEILWMRKERESRWRTRAHLRYCSPRGRSEQVSAEYLAGYIRWWHAAAHSPVCQKSYLVSTSPVEFTWSQEVSSWLGLGGIEIRSDFFEQELQCEAHRPMRVLASLRTANVEWLNNYLSADAWDIDLSYFPQLLSSGLLRNHPPRTLLISAHPDRAGDAVVAQLLEAASSLQREHPRWNKHVVLKYAPSVDGYQALEQAYTHRKRLVSSGYPVTFLPQGSWCAWLRPMLAIRYNATNYIAAGVHSSTSSRAGVYNLQTWLPHLAPPHPVRFDGLIGFPVEASIGDVWHRHAAMRDDGTYGYLKIPIEASTPESLDDSLRHLHRIGIRGLSVTSPHKRTVLDCTSVSNTNNLRAANTLIRTACGWKAADTDHYGLYASLNLLEERGVVPGSVAVFGKGGVSHAVIDCLKASKWHVVAHVGAREGWSSADLPEDLQLIINASGSMKRAGDDPPRARAWLDLHYTDVETPPPSVQIHLNGDAFFEAQAQAQRNYWYKEDTQCVETALDNF